jgi:hypothetical protein
MTPSGFKTKMKAAEIEAAIMKRLAEKADCEAIIHIYIKPTGQEPPEDTWTHTLISRRAIPRSAMETKTLHDVLNELRKEIDLTE